MKITLTEPLLRIGCHLGEAPLYDPQTGILHFVDILEKKLYHLNTESLQYSVDEFSDPITCLALRKEGKGLACCASRGFGLIEEGRLKYIKTPIDPERSTLTRFNDGACDSKGVFFAGTIFNKGHGIPGMLYRYDPRNDKCDIVDSGPFTDSNGLGWSPDEKTFYFTDSKTNIIYAYDYNNGEISNRRIFIDGSKLDNSGFADGCIIDKDGCIWSARWEGSKILRYTPDGKAIDLEVALPTVYKVTALCFGGHNNDQLYITTARATAVDGHPDLQETYPDSGHLFHLDFSGKFGGLERGRFPL